jgi:hypothetical protein
MRRHSSNESGEPVQLAFDVGFDPMIERAQAVQLGDLLLRVATKQDLIERRLGRTLVFDDQLDLAAQDVQKLDELIDAFLGVGRVKQPVELRD